LPVRFFAMLLRQVSPSQPLSILGNTIDPFPESKRQRNVIFSPNLIARRFDIYDLAVPFSRCLLATTWLSVNQHKALQPSQCWSQRWPTIVDIPIFKLTFSSNLTSRRSDIYDSPASLSRCLLATMWLSVKDLPVLLLPPSNAGARSGQLSRILSNQKFGMSFLINQVDART
jgi:hypothetical protein